LSALKTDRGADNDQYYQPLKIYLVQIFVWSTPLMGKNIIWITLQKYGKITNWEHIN